MSRWSASVRGAFLVLLGGLCWSTGGVGIKLLTGYSPVAIISGRSALCALFFLALLRGRVFPPAGSFKWVAAGTLCYAGLVTCFVSSTKLTTAANAIYLESTTPLWIALLAWLFRGDKPSRIESLALAAGAVGVGLCMMTPSIPGVGAAAIPAAPSAGAMHALSGWMPSLGNALALSAGLLFALLTMVLRRLSKVAPGGNADDHDPRPALLCILYGNTLAASICLPALMAALPNPGIPGRAPIMGWLVLLWLGIGQLGLGYWFYQRGLRTVNALTASLVGLSEPLLNPIWVALVVAEIPALTTRWGGVFVLISVVLSIFRGSETSEKPSSSKEGNK